nr:MAG TPA: hypothetical protein [Caudoviricetes sp.]
MHKDKFKIYIFRTNLIYLYAFSYICIDFINSLYYN